MGKHQHYQGTPEMEFSLTFLMLLALCLFLWDKDTFYTFKIQYFNAYGMILLVLR